MNERQARKFVNQVMQAVCANAVLRFDAITPVGWVVLKVNPACYGKFVCRAILSNDQRFEGRLPQSSRRAAWCMKPNC